MHRVWPPFSKSKDPPPRKPTSVVLAGRAGAGTCPPLGSWSSSSSSSSSTCCSVEPLHTSLQLQNHRKPRRPTSGKGEFKWASGLSYSGEYKGEVREGFGKLTWPDGSSYEGYFHNDLREGMGKHKWDCGEVRCVKFY